MFEWLENHPQDKNSIMESVERVLTQTGTLEKRYDGLVDAYLYVLFDQIYFFFF